MRHRSDVSRTSRAFSPKMARRSRSSAVSSVSPLGVTLPTRISPGLHLGADADDAALVEVLQGVFAHVGDIPGDLFGAQLGVAGVALVFLDVDGGEDVFLDQLLADQDGVLVVVAFPGHEGHQDIAAQGQLALVGRRPSAMTSPRSTRWPSLTMGFWLMQVPWLDRLNLSSWYWSTRPSSVRMTISSAVDLLDHAGILGQRAPRPSRRPPCTPCPCRPAAPRSAGAAPPGAACWSPSGPGWRRRSPGRGSAPSRCYTICLGETSMKST